MRQLLSVVLITVLALPVRAEDTKTAPPPVPADQQAEARMGSVNGPASTSPAPVEQAPMVAPTDAKPHDEKKKEAKDERTNAEWAWDNMFPIGVITAAATTAASYRLYGMGQAYRSHSEFTEKLADLQRELPEGYENDPRIKPHLDKTRALGDRVVDKIQQLKSSGARKEILKSFGTDVCAGYLTALGRAKETAAAPFRWFSRAPKKPFQDRPAIARALDPENPDAAVVEQVLKERDEFKKVYDEWRDEAKQLSKAIQSVTGKKISAPPSTDDLARSMASRDPDPRVLHDFMEDFARSVKGQEEAIRKGTKSVVADVMNTYQKGGYWGLTKAGFSNSMHLLYNMTGRPMFAALGGLKTGAKGAGYAARNALWPLQHPWQATKNTAVGAVEGSMWLAGKSIDLTIGTALSAGMKVSPEIVSFGLGTALYVLHAMNVGDLQSKHAKEIAQIANDNRKPMTASELERTQTELMILATTNIYKKAQSEGTVKTPRTAMQFIKDEEGAPMDTSEISLAKMLNLKTKAGPLAEKLKITPAEAFWVSILNEVDGTRDLAADEKFYAENKRAIQSMAAELENISEVFETDFIELAALKKAADAKIKAEADAKAAKEKAETEKKAAEQKARDEEQQREAAKRKAENAKAAKAAPAIGTTPAAQGTGPVGAPANQPKKNRVPAEEPEEETSEQPEAPKKKNKVP